jgi:hypothetical protein
MTMMVTLDHEGNPGSAARAANGRGWTGAWIGAAIALLPTLAGLAAGVPLLALGIPAAAVAGGIVGPRVRPDRGVVGVGLAMAVLTVLVADTIVVGGLGLAGLAGSSPDASLISAAVGALFLWTVGLIVVGIPALAVTIPCGLAWAALARRRTGAARSTVTR